MQRLLVLFSILVVSAARAEQLVAFDAAHATSTYSAGNLAGSPAFAAQQALSGGSGYWCSSGSHDVAQSVVWTGILNSRRTALGVTLDWAYAPGEVKILTSSDGANFEEAKCWQSSTRKEVAFEETFMFDAPRNVKAVTIVMRSPQSWGYFGINSAVLIAEPGPIMLVSGITSSDGEQCLVASASGVNLERCLDAIASGDGREILRLDEDGQVVSMADGKCMALANGDTTGGGMLIKEKCSGSIASGDGRSVFVVTPNGQLKMPHIGNYCLAIAGDGASDADVARTAHLAATSSSAEHDVKNVADEDAKSYWSSAPDAALPVDVLLDFGETKQIKAVEIEWEHPAQAFELQVASHGSWTTAYATSGNNQQGTRYVGPAIAGSALRVRMTKPHPTLGNSGGHAVYGIKNVRVIASTTRVIVQDCAEAEGSQDARDKFFMVAVPEFDPSAASAARQSAALLGAAQGHLGNLLAGLYAAMPSLATCGFQASLATELATTLLKSQSMHMDRHMRRQDATSAAVAAVAPAMGVDMQALRELVMSTREALARVSR